jgi:hypothetical protein
VRTPTVSELVEDARHGGGLSGAARLGEATDGDRIVRVGLWTAPSGRVERARFMSATCASLVAFAEAGCRLAEAGALAGVSDLAALLRASVSGVHPHHLRRADLVASAFVRALAPEGDSP